MHAKKVQYLQEGGYREKMLHRISRYWSSILAVKSSDCNTSVP